MDNPLRKVTARVDLSARTPHQSRSRPASPTKHSPSSLSPSTFRPKATVNSNTTVRKLSSSSSLSATKGSNVSPSASRPGSPLRPSRMLPNGSEASSSPKARITARPTSRPRTSPIQSSSASLEPRQRALTTASAKLKLLPSEDRPRSGSVVALHHALSISELNAYPPVPSQSHRSADSPLQDMGRVNTPPLPPIKIKSRVTGLVKSASSIPADALSRSLSPPYATTRPIHARARTPSITTSFSLNDPTPSAFYPITTASPAANPHRFASRRAPSPARSFPSPTPASELYSAKKFPLIPKVDPASVPLPPHSPPISALSISSKSSVSKTSVSPNTDQMTDNQISRALSHIKHPSMEWAGQSGALFAQVDLNARTRRNRSRSKERSPLDRGDSDAESDGSERQLRAEAKTNRKIADLEITNRSLLAINASLETTKNRQAKEIRDLRRKLRESRLILPPRTFKAVKSTLEEEHSSEDEDEEDSDVEQEDTDETYQRVRGLIDNLIESGKSALETRSEDLRASLATKVLNADELRSWRDFGQDGYTDKEDADDQTIRSRHLSPALLAVPDSGNASSAESDGEQTLDLRGSSALPPITITHTL